MLCQNFVHNANFFCRPAKNRYFALAVLRQRYTVCFQPDRISLPPIVFNFSESNRIVTTVTGLEPIGANSPAGSVNYAFMYKTNFTMNRAVTFERREQCAYQMCVAAIYLSRSEQSGSSHWRIHDQGAFSFFLNFGKTRVASRAGQWGGGGVVGGYGLIPRSNKGKIHEYCETQSRQVSGC